MNFVKAGSAFLIRDRKMGMHLFFVLTDPDAADRLVVAVALVTERSHTDKTCTLEVGDHPFIRHTSNIDYGSATFIPKSKLDESLRSGVAKLQPDLSPAVLARVQAGVFASSRTINAVVDYCRLRFESRT